MAQDDVERVAADRRLGDRLFARRPPDRSHVHADGLDLCAAFGAQLIEESLQCCAGTALGDVEHATVVVVGDDSEVLVAALVGDFVDADVEHVVEAAVVEMFGHDAHHHCLHRLPRHPQQPTHAGLVGPLRKPGDEVLDITSEPSTGPRPRHVLGPDPRARSTVHPPDLGLEPQLRRRPDRGVAIAAWSGHNPGLAVRTGNDGGGLVGAHRPRHRHR